MLSPRRHPVPRVAKPTNASPLPRHCCSSGQNMLLFYFFFNGLLSPQTGSSLSRRSRALQLCRGRCWSRVAHGSPSLQGHGQVQGEKRGSNVWLSACLEGARSNFGPIKLINCCWKEWRR